MQGTIFTILSFSPEIINVFVEAKLLKDYSAIAKLALPLGLILTVLGLRKGYQADNLFDGLSNMLDNIPNKLTGERGNSIKN